MLNISQEQWQNEIRLAEVLDRLGFRGGRLRGTALNRDILNGFQLPDGVITISV